MDAHEPQSPSLLPRLPEVHPAAQAHSPFQSVTTYPVHLEGLWEEKGQQ